MNLKPELNTLSILSSQGFVHARPELIFNLCDYIIDRKIEVDKFFVRKLDSSLENFKRKILDFEKNKTVPKRDSNQYYQRISKFYNDVRPFFDDWQSVVQIKEKQHPYQKFARENDKLFSSFKRRTENLQLRD